MSDKRYRATGIFSLLVNSESAIEAKNKAIQVLNGSCIDGCVIDVEEAKE